VGAVQQAAQRPVRLRTSMGSGMLRSPLPVCQSGRAEAQALALDWGVETYATLAKEDGTLETIDNPTFLRRAEHKLKAAYQMRDGKQKFSRGWRIANKKIALLHSKVARQRKDFQHKLSAKLVGQASAIFTEHLRVKNLTRRPKSKYDTAAGQYLSNGAAAKAGLNKAILDGAPATFLGMLRYKAAEAGTCTYVEAPTHTVKPSQTCHACGRREKKRLEQRWHACSCGAQCSRDANSALVLLQWGMQHFLTVFLAGLWRCNNRSQELTPCCQAQDLQCKPQV
jgi:putative transposase